MERFLTFLQEPAVLGFVGGVIGAVITYIVAPFAKGFVEAQKEKRERRRLFVERARTAVMAADSNASKHAEPFAAHIQKMRGYLDIEDRLGEEIRERINSAQTQRVAVVQPDSPAGIQGLARDLLTEISKLEEKWKLI